LNGDAITTQGSNLPGYRYPMEAFKQIHTH